MAGLIGNRPFDAGGKQNDRITTAVNVQSLREDRQPGIEPSKVETRREGYANVTTAFHDAEQVGAACALKSTAAATVEIIRNSETRPFCLEYERFAVIGLA